MAPIYQLNLTEDEAEGFRKLGYNPIKINESSKAVYSPNADIIKSDYIKLGIKNIEKNFDENKGFDIAIGKTGFNKNHKEQNISLLEKGLRMSNIPQYMEFHNAVIDAYKNNKPLFNSEGNGISRNVIRDLYRQVTSDEWVNLNAEFEKSSSGIYTLSEAVGLNKNKEIIYDSRKISVPIQDDIYVNPKNLTKEGLPKEKASNQEFERGEKIYFYYPRNNSVAGFYAVPVRSGLYCGRYPLFSDSVLGVRATKLRE